jgi:hypothetical protein
MNKAMTRVSAAEKLLRSLEAAWQKGGMTTERGASVWIKAGDALQEVVADLVGRLPSGYVTVFAGGRVVQLLPSELA